MAENNVQDQDQIKLPDPIIFTDAASLKVKELIAKRATRISNSEFSFRAADAPASSTVSLLMKPLTKTTP